MMLTKTTCCLLMLLAGITTAVQVSEPRTEDILMPGAKPQQMDAYLCTAHPVSDVEAYIYKFEALADATTAHHMLLYGCDGPAFSSLEIWPCHVMCKGSKSSILFAWAKNAPPTVLPKDVGFRIGSNTSIKTLVLQVHYAKQFEESDPADHSGMKIYITQTKPQFVAGIFLLMDTSFTIPNGKKTYPVDISCENYMDASIFPFAYRTHAHGLGRVITGYQYNGTYHEIGKGNPQWPQAFYPANKNIEVKPGDFLAARCTYDSTSMVYPVSVGSTGNDEMCNFYIMFYTDSSVQDPSGSCGGNDIPEITGKHFPLDVSDPLPPNPDLEEEAKGTHHHGGMSGSHSTVINDTQTEEILMRGAKPTQPDAYLCTAYHLDQEEYFIYKFEALADVATVHHMLLYGCNGEPYSTESIWHCPAMCKDAQPSILFAWAKNAPPTVLPPSVGFRIGKKSSIKTLVLQVHYAKSFTANEKEDTSGIKLYTTHQKQDFVAGIFLLADSSFSIPNGNPAYPVDISCKFPMQKSIVPFAYRTHAHGLGRVITGYQYNGTHHTIGKGNPQWPQTFYPVQEKIEIKPGDSLAARCTYDSTSMDKPVNVGSTGNDEMCNFYIMFYTDSSVQDPSGSCGGNDIPEITGNNFPPDVSVPLPPNPDLEEEAKGPHHHGGPSGTHNTVIDDTQTEEILMKGAKPTEPDAYLCTAYHIDQEEYFIYKFEALADAATVHHMLLYGCNGDPYSSEDIWPCPSMCKDGQSSILFAWAKNAPPTVLPTGVGLRIGKKSTVKTLVLQVHYAKSFTSNEKEDHSGLKIYTTHHKQDFVAGIFLLADSFFSIPKGNPAYPVDISCKFPMEKSIVPFAYRTHAHGLGRVITGYQYNGTYHTIGKGNPQWPQTFYPVQEKIEIKPGDSLAARCTYDSTSMDRTVDVGSTGNDEMCNFYIMFYTDSSVQDPSGSCGGNDIPQITGKNFPPDVSVPLPPNPALEEEAKGTHHHGGPPGSQNTGIHFDHPLVVNSPWPDKTLKVGQIGGLATDKHGNVYIFHRGSRQWTADSFGLDNNFLRTDTPIAEDVIVILDSQGRLVRQFGAGQYFMPHGIEVDQEGNIWVTDVALHQVFKIAAGESKPTLTLGQRFQHGEDTTLFCKPTDVAVLSNGDFFISDGYCNSRVLKFSKDGTLLKSWGQSNSQFSKAPPAGTFDIPHSITVLEEKQLVCVADRENGRIQCFDLEGNNKHIIQHPQFGPRLFAIESSPEHGGLLYAVNGPGYDGPTDFIVQGFTLDIETGDLLEIWNVPQHLKNPHDVCVDVSSHSVFVGELDPQQVWKLTRTTEQKTPQDAVKTLDNHEDTSLSQQTLNATISPPSESNDFSPSVIIGILLVIPVVLLLVLALLVRAHQSGKLKCYGHNKKRMFNLQGIIGNSHKGFDPLSTEESDHELDPEDNTQYLAPKKIKSKA
ncbi:peptidyl-glycine alpha-amidating monooxygenase B-like isoform X2 [Physella acuta]|uniref:peptidyl-glycine alpha-amidating monooxygenase B-like isoform X2 n=1 Tax=Physella acuta TaxID=109671 RepID=UPI0027DE3AED|nr:peptidyl-glycine alpha-amidating monooxygenase B-like isoform X2 [Physella acuta]